MLPMYPGMPIAAPPVPAATPGSPVPGQGRLVASGYAEGPPFPVPSGAPTVVPPGFQGLPPPRFGPGGMPLPPAMPGTAPGQLPLVQVPPHVVLSRLWAAGQLRPVIPLGVGTSMAPIAPVLPPGLPAPGAAAQR